MNEKKFTKDDLKAGYIVKMRDGSLNMVTIDNDDKLTMVDKDGGWMPVHVYDKNLCHRSSIGDIWPAPADPQYDIMEVYGGSRLYSAALTLDTSYRKLLWKREEKTCDSCAHKVVCNHVGMCEHYMETSK